MRVEARSRFDKITAVRILGIPNPYRLQIALDSSVGDAPHIMDSNSTEFDSLSFHGGCDLDSLSIAYP